MANDENEPTLIVAMVCGGSQAQKCRVDGGEHDMTAEVRNEAEGWQSLACRKCGVLAMTLDMMELS
jgi:hypothetical protein